MGKFIPDTERVYIVFNSCAATRYLTLSKQIKGWEKALDECFGVINAEIDSYNSIINYFKIDHPGFKEVREALENGQNFTIGKHTIGIKDITPDVNYEDYIILIKSESEIPQKLIDIMQWPFDDESFFRNFMQSICEDSNAKYRLITIKNFDKDYSKLKEYNYVIHTKLGF